ncbi:hypothetical protein ABZ619_41300 [Streptomyces sp. NPDC007851]
MVIDGTPLASRAVFTAAWLRCVYAEAPEEDDFLGHWRSGQAA